MEVGSATSMPISWLIHFHMADFTGSPTPKESHQRLSPPLLPSLPPAATLWPNPLTYCQKPSSLSSFLNSCFRSLQPLPGKPPGFSSPLAEAYAKQSSQNTFCSSVEFESLFEPVLNCLRNTQRREACRRGRSSVPIALPITYWVLSHPCPTSHFYAGPGPRLHHAMRCKDMALHLLTLLLVCPGTCSPSFGPFLTAHTISTAVSPSEPTKHFYPWSVRLCAGWYNCWQLKG